MNHKIVFIIITSFTSVMLALSACNPGNPYRLSDPGKYKTGTRMNYEFKDTDRDNRPVSITVWYPAVLPKDASSNNYVNAQPDLSDAPYPLILSSAKIARVFGPHLASHGFIAVGVNGQDASYQWGPWLIDYPLDILFALDQIVSKPLDGLDGMIDIEHVGVMGYSFDGYTSLALSGARIDPEFYLTQCAEATTKNPATPEWWIDYICNLKGGWDGFVDHAGSAITVSDDGLWQPMTDERILAVMPMAPEGAWLFGERGLAAVDRPTLIIGASADIDNIYELEAAYIFEHLGTPDRFLITFVDWDHGIISTNETLAQMKHFATAFFGYYLQGRDNYSKYFSKEFVTQRDYLAWGVYTDK